MNLLHESGWISSWFGIYFVPESHFMMSFTGSLDPQTTRAYAVKIRRKKTSYRAGFRVGLKFAIPHLQLGGLVHGLGFTLFTNFIS